MTRASFALLFLFSCLSAWSQPRQPNAAEIKVRLKKLNVLGSVLYVAAHPDDENTRVIAYLANERLASTAYLSMTRGDGGQNLIGPEIRDLLGLIRTQELLAARRIDHGEQFFTRANDFGFSKNYQETFSIWNKDIILSDVVRVIRQYQPDVIITRFPADERAGHGHHTGSAILAEEAFDAAAKPESFADQLSELQTWQTKRLFTNTGRWWNNTINENTPGIVTLNVGAYNALLGESYSEMAAESRTQHKSQGFGSPGRRGDALEFFEHVKGEKAGDIFDGINTSWSRIKGGERVEGLITSALTTFDYEKPHLSVTSLLQVRKAIQSLDAGVWRDRKLAEVNSLIQDCLGLFAEVTASQNSAAPGEPVQLSFELVNRSPAQVRLIGISSNVIGLDSTTALPMAENQLITFKSRKTVSLQAAYSAPYWLQEDHPQGHFEVKDKRLIGRPESSAAVELLFQFEVAGEAVQIKIPLIRKWTDPVKGELWQPFEITPPVSVEITSNVFVFSNTKPQPVSVMIKSYADRALDGDLSLQLPAGWRAEPASHPFELTKRNEEKTFAFLVYPSAGEAQSEMKAIAKVGNGLYDKRIQTISYDHIPTQTLLPTARAKVISMQLKREGSLVAYIKGAGDDVPAALRNLGYEVWEMKNEEVTPENLKRVDAVVLGVRALNTNERIKYFMPSLLAYVKEGGTLVSQYNTNFDLEIDADKFSPFPLKLSRDRVTEENSEVKILNPGHVALTKPNLISDSDFQGWVQERGLYFPSEWDPAFEPLLSMHDSGEPERKGGLLVARYGNGHYVYTGLSFFRELPEGVPGAYKLFANLVSLGKVSQPQNQKIKPSRQ